MARDRGWGLVATLVAVVALISCGPLEPTLVRSTFEISADGFRTFTIARAQPPATCGDFLAEDPLIGTLEGDPQDPELVWIRVADGVRRSIVWPHGFHPVFGATGLVLINETGEPVARAGETVKLTQVRLSEHAGTFEDPYVAGGVTFARCYPYVP